MKTLKFCLFFSFIVSAQFSFSQQQTIKLQQHNLKVEKVSIGDSYNGMAPYNPDKNAEFDKILIVELVIISGNTNIKFGEGDFETWLTDDLNNKIIGKDEAVLTKEKTITYLYNISSKAKSFKMHFGKSKTVDLRPTE